MWDDRRKVGVLNDFDLAKFADQKGASGQDNTGTLPFMALDLLSVRGLRGEIARLYRHEAESFAWCLICLYFATVKDSEGNSRTRSPHPLLEWFQGWQRSRNAKIALLWDDENTAEVPLAHQNTRMLARFLHEYWLDRFKRQFPDPPRGRGPQRLAGLLGIDHVVSTTGDPLYEEPGDDRVFEEILVEHESALYGGSLQDIGDGLFEMTSKYKEIDWHA